MKPLEQYTEKYGTWPWPLGTYISLNREAWRGHIDKVHALQECQCSFELPSHTSDKGVITCLQKKGNMSRRGPVDLEALISDKELGTGHLVWVHDPGELVNPYCWL